MVRQKDRHIEMTNMDRQNTSGTLEQHDPSLERATPMRDELEYEPMRVGGDTVRSRPSKDHMIRRSRDYSDLF